MKVLLKKLTNKIPKVLSIAGSDCSSGAGIQADIKTVQSLGGYCSTVITSVTSQDSKKVYNAYSIPEEIVKSQLLAIHKDIGFDAVKIGLVPNIKIAIEIYNFFKNKNIPIILDPVFKSSSGKKFLSKSKFKAIQGFLMSVSSVIIPSLLEAKVLSGEESFNLNDMKSSAEKIYLKNNISVLIKGNELNNNAIIDILMFSGKFFVFKSKRINSTRTHGTGCTLSSSIAFYMAKGFEIKRSIKLAKKYLRNAILNSPDLGVKYGPLGH